MCARLLAREVGAFVGLLAVETEPLLVDIKLVAVVVEIPNAFCTLCRMEYIHPTRTCCASSLSVILSMLISGPAAMANGSDERRRTRVRRVQKKDGTYADAKEHSEKCQSLSKCTTSGDLVKK